MTRYGGQPTRDQRARDANGLRNACCACGNDGSAERPLMLINGQRIHADHTTDPGTGFYREAS